MKRLSCDTPRGGFITEMWCRCRDGYGIWIFIENVCLSPCAADRMSRSIHTCISERSLVLRIVWTNRLCSAGFRPSWRDLWTRRRGFNHRWLRRDPGTPANVTETWLTLFELLHHHVTSGHRDVVRGVLLWISGRDDRHEVVTVAGGDLRKQENGVTDERGRKMFNIVYRPVYKDVPKLN